MCDCEEQDDGFQPHYEAESCHNCEADPDNMEWEGDMWVCSNCGSPQ